MSSAGGQQLPYSFDGGGDGDDNVRYDAQPSTARAYYFLLTIPIAIIAWLVSLVGQAIVTARLGNFLVGPLWFAIFIQLYILIHFSWAVFLTPPHILPLVLSQITTLSAIVIVFGTFGINSNLFNSPTAAQKALTAGWFMTVMIDTVWIGYCTGLPETRERIHAFGLGGGGNGGRGPTRPGVAPNGAPGKDVSYRGSSLVPPMSRPVSTQDQNGQQQQQQYTQPYPVSSLQQQQQFSGNDDPTKRPTLSLFVAPLRRLTKRRQRPGVPQPPPPPLPPPAGDDTEMQMQTRYQQYGGNVHQGGGGVVAPQNAYLPYDAENGAGGGGGGGNTGTNTNTYPPSSTQDRTSGAVSDSTGTGPATVPVSAAAGTTGHGVGVPITEPPREVQEGLGLGQVQPEGEGVPETPGKEGEPKPYLWRAETLYNYTGNDKDPNELSFTKGETLEICDKSGKWWEARRSNGVVGIIPSNYVRLL